MAYVNVQMLTPLNAEIRQQKCPPYIYIYIGSQNKLHYLGKTTISFGKLKIDYAL